MSRDPETIQREIEQARDALASTLDQLADRASPSRLVDNGKRSVHAFFASPKGRIVLGSAGAIVVLLVVRRIRLARRSSSTDD